MSIRNDIKYTVRSLLSSRRFTVVIALTFAIGIGANAVVFTVANAVLLKGLPYVDSDRLVSVRLRSLENQFLRSKVPSLLLEALAERNSTLSQLAGYVLAESSLALPSGEPMRLNVAAVSPTLCQVLGVSGAVRGRLLRAEDAVWGGPPVAVVSYRFWRDFLGSAEDLAKLDLRLNGRRHTVVGVLGEAFRFPDLVTPLVLVPLSIPPGGVAASLDAVGRLKAGASIESAMAELNEILRVSLPSLHPAPPELGTVIVDVIPLRQHLAGDLSRSLAVAAAVAAVVFLIACGNVAGLQLARIAGRDKELEIRTALGSTRRQLSRLFAVEGMILGALGGVGAFVALNLSMVSLRQALTPLVANPDSVGVDSHVVLFIVGAVAIAAVVVTAVPVVRLSTARLQLTRSRARSSVGHLVVAGQLAGAVILVFSALLLLGTLWRLSTAAIGFEPRNTLTLRVPGIGPTWARNRSETLQSLLEHLRLVPNVRSVAATTALPLDGHGFHFGIPIAGQPPPSDDATMGVDVISPGYFETMQISLRFGRGFVPEDDQNSPRVAVVNQAFTRLRGLEGSEALGRLIAMGGGAENASIEIVGIAEDVNDGKPGDAAQPIVYRPFAQARPNIQWSTANIVVRTTGKPEELVEPIRKAIKRRLPDATVYDVRSMDNRISSLIAPERDRAMVFTLFGATGLTLAAVGLYGLLTYIVAQETREYGVRLAIGSSQWQIAALVVDRGLRATGGGLAVGLGCAALVERGMSSVLPGIAPAGPVTYGSCAIISVAVAATASYVPVRKAMQTDPVALLRN